MKQPYTQRTLADLQLEIDAYEDSTPHEQLPARYDALVSLRNAKLLQERRNDRRALAAEYYQRAGIVS